MRIVSYNVNRFNRTHDWYRNGDLTLCEREKNADKIVKYITKHIQSKEDIAFLQEFPYYKNGTKGIEYDEWEKRFEKYGLTIKRSYAEGLNLTVAVVKKNTLWKKIGKSEKSISFGEDGKDYLNKYIEVSKDNVNIIGMHSPDARTLYEGLEKIGDNETPSFIIGDLNSGDYIVKDSDQAKEENCQYYRNIIDEFGYTDLCNNAVTFPVADTPIDHCLMKKDIRKLYDVVSVDVSKKDMSDHYPIIVELKNK